MKVQNYRFIVMVVFSKFITGQRGSQQLLDTDGFTYNLRKDRATSSTTTWRCSKNRSKKCPSFVYFNPADESLTAGPKEHNHPADALVEQNRYLISSPWWTVSFTCVKVFSVVFRNPSRLSTELISLSLWLPGLLYSWPLSHLSILNLPLRPYPCILLALILSLWQLWTTLS